MKVIVLNRLYSTNIYDVHTVAKHICDSDIDADLAAAAPKLVDRIAAVTFSTGKKLRLYSFATKYCAWHRPDVYEIYDRYVRDVLIEHQRHHNFSEKFAADDLLNYDRFRSVIAAFRSHFGLEEHSRKDIDKFLWIEGRLSNDGVMDNELPA